MVEDDDDDDEKAIPKTASGGRGQNHALLAMKGSQFSNFLLRRSSSL